VYEKAAHFLYSDTYGFIGEYLHISWQSRLVGRRSKAGDSIGGLPATGIAVYVADISPPISTSLRAGPPAKRQRHATPMKP